MKSCSPLIFLCALLGMISCKPAGVEESFPTLDQASKTVELPARVRESSGLAWAGGTLWTHNDSGDDPLLYQVDTNGVILRQVFIREARAVDWEDLSRDSAFLYIGDFGNNKGRRNDLAVYRLPITALSSGADTIEPQTIIHFRYADQWVYAFKGKRHNFDCEALAAAGDSLYLFSKNHLDGQVRMYALPRRAGRYVPEPSARFNARGRITGAAFDPVSGTLALLGEGQRQFKKTAFIWLFRGFPANRLREGQRFDLNAVSPRAEAIAFADTANLWISAEGFGGKRPKLYLLPLPGKEAASQSEMFK